MRKVNDKHLSNISWIPNSSPDFMQGESRAQGRVIQIKGWIGKSDRKKLKMLREMARTYGGDPHLRWFVVNNILKPAGVAQRDFKKQAAAMLSWVQQNIYYTNEPDEQVQTPWRTIAVKTGDCDDSSLLLASFAEAIKMPWKFALAGQSPTGKRVRFIEGERMPWGAQFSHIYVVLGWPPFQPQEWASAETTIRGAPLGYDVTVDGIKPFNEVVTVRTATTTGPSSMGNPQVGGLVEVAADNLEQRLQKSELPNWVKTLPWDGIITGVIQGVITTLIVRWAITVGERRARGK